MKPVLKCCSETLLVLLLTVSAPTQNYSEEFSFCLPPEETGTTPCAPQLSPFPLTDTDFVSIDRNELFAISGMPLCSFSVNPAADAAFPPASEGWFFDTNKLTLVCYGCPAAMCRGEEKAALFVTARALNTTQKTLH
jgi:hypothetical protein